MKLLRKIVRYLDRIVDAGIFIVCMLIFLAGSYALYDSYLVYQNANDTSLLKYKPGYEGEEPDKPIKGKMTAWLTIDHTTIDYPVMQGESNDDYLNMDPYGEYSLSGSIFLDYRNDSGFMDDYSLIYGHHMEHHMMFGELDLYTGDEKFYREHTSGTLTLNNRDADTYRLRVFAVLEASATTEEIFAPTLTEKTKTIEYIRQHALYLDEEMIRMRGEKDRIVGLSTCKYPDTADRTIVFCFMDSRKAPEEKKKTEETDGEEKTGIGGAQHRNNTSK